MVLTKTTPDPYTLVSSAHHDTVYSDFEDVASGKYADLDAQLIASIRNHHPGMTVTVIPTSYANLAAYAAAGYARAELDTSEDSLLRWRYYQTSSTRGGQGHLGEVFFFVRFKYTWKNIEFIVYTVREGMITLNYILFPPDDDETVLSHSKVTDALLQAVGEIQFAVEGTILVFERYWTRSRALYEQVQKASWDDVILDKKMKKTLTETVVHFFDSEKSYKDLDVPWKRGLIFYGPAGCGKTISIKALMHTLSIRENPVVSLYVKALHNTYEIGSVFRMARTMTPCLLILEDVDTLITEELRSYFFNEVDGLDSNDGIMMVATTNHLDQLDGGLAKRPSRFDRKYNFPTPDREERILYCDYWKQKLRHNKKVEFPEELPPAIADITQDFTFAYLKEAFVASLLTIARQDEERDDEDEDGDRITSPRNDDPGFHDKLINTEKDISNLPLWIEIQKQVKMLREDMDSEDKEVKKNTLWGFRAPSTRPMPPRANGCFPSASARRIPPLQADTEAVHIMPSSETPSEEDQTVIRMRAAFNRKTDRQILGLDKELHRST
ncbi:hypothetical protein EPUS_01114 [Endocarpon pusillum Z07020]|uniref:AAA+ ATPase domain-containing protein n=1 Tax=Endocarpon pusillum (strain Z07020 / HMAS-L-300199) TaxID=1263415 RepID=U1GAY2_ENDPU|nr:uncharacterized protein EPUS_01114 [Endocarpon pusillum Z07020]ERF69158.1 hypothetical protein EPUS_01114 [Endocarpon pusillum Z07020]